MTRTIWCPTDEQIAAWIDRGLDGAERDAMVQHLVACAHCRTVACEASEATVEHFRATAAAARCAKRQAARRRRRWLVAAILIALVALVLGVAFPA